MTILKNAQAVIDHLRQVEDGVQLSPTEVAEVEQQCGVSLKLPGEGMVIEVNYPSALRAYLITDEELTEVIKDVTGDEPEKRWTVPLVVTHDHPFLKTLTGLYINELTPEDYRLTLYQIDDKVALWVDVREEFDILFQIKRTYVGQTFGSIRVMPKPTRLVLNPDFDPEVLNTLVTKEGGLLQRPEQPRIHGGWVVERVIHTLEQEGAVDTRLIPEQIRDYEKRFGVDLQSYLLDEGKFCAVYLYSNEFDLEQGVPTSYEGALEFCVFTETQMIEVYKTFDGFPITSYQTFPLVLRKSAVESLFVALDQSLPDEPIPEELELVLDFRDSTFVTWHQESAGIYADLELKRGYVSNGVGHGTGVELKISRDDEV